VHFLRKIKKIECDSVKMNYFSESQLNQLKILKVLGSPIANFFKRIPSQLYFEIFKKVKTQQMVIFIQYTYNIHTYISVTSWCSGRLIGSPRHRSRVQDPISTINIHEGGH
jgi:hypothetical protein